MTLVSSASNIGFDKEFILRGRSLMYTVNKEALELIIWELHASMYPSQGKNFELY